MPPSKRKESKETTFKTIRLITSLVSSLGWCGTFLVVFLFILVSWPSAEQKKEIIDIYFLFKWQGNYLHVVLPLVVAGLLFIAQNRYYVLKYAKRIPLLEQEIDRISQERNTLQEKLAHRKFEHSKKGE